LRQGGVLLELIESRRFSLRTSRSLQGAGMNKVQSALEIQSPFVLSVAQRSPNTLAGSTLTLRLRAFGAQRCPEPVEGLRANCIFSNAFRLILALAISAAVGCGFARAQTTPSACARDCTFELEPFLQAPALVQSSLLDGPNYRVVPEVQVRGYMARFLIDTKFGPLTADSVELLSIRVSEIPALEALDRASKTGAFAHALSERGEKTGAAIVHVLAHPVDTVTGLPAGVVRYFSTKWDLWTGRAQSASDRASRQFENNGDPYRAPAGPMTAGRDEPAEDDSSAPEKKSRAWYARAGSEAERETKRYLKYSQAKREMAKVLGVDPNSTNPLLNEKLDDLAWAAVGGNFSAGAALGEVVGTAADVISWSGKLNQYVLTKTPEQLREINRTRLLKFCSDDFAVRQFLRRGGFTDTLRAALADSLEKLKPQTGCNELIELGATTRGEIEARYLVDGLRLIERQQDAVGGTLFVAGAAIGWRTPAGKIVLPLPVDYLTWSHDIGDFFDRPEFASAEKTVLVGGEASMSAQRNLTARGWSLVLGAPYEGAPKYAPAASFSSL
jgi:hypothetical protein